MRAVLAVFLLAILALTGCSRFPTYTGPEVTQIIVNKSARQLIPYCKLFEN